MQVIRSIFSTDGDEDGPIPPEMYARDPGASGERTSLAEKARFCFWLTVTLACMATMVASICVQMRRNYDMAKQLGWI